MEGLPILIRTPCIPTTWRANSFRPEQLHDWPFPDFGRVQMERMTPEFSFESRERCSGARKERKGERANLGTHRTVAQPSHLRKALKPGCHRSWAPKARLGETARGIPTPAICLVLSLKFARRTSCTKRRNSLENKRPRDPTLAFDLVSAFAGDFPGSVPKRASQSGNPRKYVVSQNECSWKGRGQKK